MSSSGNYIQYIAKLQTSNIKQTVSRSKRSCREMKMPKVVWLTRGPLASLVRQLAWIDELLFKIDSHPNNDNVFLGSLIRVLLIPDILRSKEKNFYFFYMVVICPLDDDQGPGDVGQAISLIVARMETPLICSYPFLQGGFVVKLFYSLFKGKLRALGKAHEHLIRAHPSVYLTSVYLTGVRNT